MTSENFLKAKDFFLQGLADFEKENYLAAKAHFENSLALMPERISILVNYSATLIKLDLYQEADDCCNKILKLQPDSAEANLNLGQIRLHDEKYAEALVYFDKSIGFKHDYAEAYLNRGASQHKLKQFDAAIVSYRAALNINPRYAEAYCNHGNTLLELKQLSAAVENYNKAIAINARLAEAHCNRGYAMQELRQLDAAVEGYRKAIDVNPEYADAYYNLGNALQELKQLDTAIDNYAKTLTLKPDYKFLPGTLLLTKMRVCQWEGFQQAIVQLAKDIADGKNAATPFPAIAMLDEPAIHLKAAQIYVHSEHPEMELLAPFNRRAAGSKIRIGYFSADFKEHPVSYLTAELFELHDRSRFEVFGFSLRSTQASPIQMRVSRSFDRFIEVWDKSDQEVAQLARELNIDIAVDLGGFTAESRTNIFALRAAPLQIGYLGYLGTMGAKYMDYLVADKVICPPHLQDFYSEKIVHMHSYQVNDSKRKISARKFQRQELGLPEKGVVFCCFNNNYKILPATFDGWMRILKAVPGSVLFLFAENKWVTSNLQHEAESRGIAKERLVFGQRLHYEDYLARYSVCDLFLDTRPYNAGTTASDALWSGLPVLTCTGQSFASRVAASLLQAIEMPELVTHTQEEYEAKAIELATAPGALQELKNKLEANRLTTALFDTARFTKHLEMAYETMCARSQAGLPPDHIYVGIPDIAKIIH